MQHAEARVHAAESQRESSPMLSLPADAGVQQTASRCPINEGSQPEADTRALLKQHFPAWRKTKEASAEYHMLPVEVKALILERLTGHLLDVHSVRQVRTGRVADRERAG